MKWKFLVSLAVFFFCGISIGLWVGQKTALNNALKVACRPAEPQELDSFYTNVLKVSDEQKTELTEIQQRYQNKRNHFTNRMHKANLQLADVIEHEGYESDKIQPLVSEIHAAMGELQTLSLTHLATIEKVLDQNQAALLKNNAVMRLRQN